MTYQTLAEQLNAKRLPAADALRMATQIGERLAQWHANGECHGSLTPEAIALNGAAVELRPATASGITPYTAPEVVLGEPADKRSDIFSFGAIVYEMFSGVRAFAGETPGELSESLLNEEPEPYGAVLVDRLLGRCLTKPPEARFASAQRLQLELSLLASAARRGAVIEPAAKAVAAAAGAGAHGGAVAAVAESGRNDIHALETRMATRLEEQERSIATVERIASEVLKAVREGGLAVQARPAERGPERRFGEYDDPALARLDRAFALLSEKVSRIDLAVTTALEKLDRFEESLDAWDGDAATLRDSVTRDLRNFDRTLKSQSAAIESTRTAMAQTDDLVERVVEALDSLQSNVVTDAPERKAS